jgi:hypothetical protein
VAAAIAVVLLLTASRPQPAQAADCGVGGIDTFSSGTLTIEGPGLCSDHAEYIKAYCNGNVLIDYAFIDTNNLSATEDTGVPCDSVSVVDVEGLNGGDRIEMTTLGSVRLANGGAGDDTLLLRNGVNDAGDCGEGVDSVQADQSKLDGVQNCEVQDFLPDPAAPVQAKKKKCKKKKHRAVSAKKRCKKKH